MTRSNDVINFGPPDPEQERICEALTKVMDRIAIEGGTPDFVYTGGVLYHHGELFTGEFDGSLWEDGRLVAL